MLVSDVFTRLQRTFGDESAAQVTEADCIRWINDAQKEAVMQNEGLLQKVGFLNTTLDEDEYTLPTDLFALHHVYYKDSSVAAYFKLRSLGLTEFSETIDGWDGTEYSNGFPQIFTQQESNKIVLFPRPQETVTNGLKLIYSRYPTDVTTSASVVDLPKFYDNYVVNYCLVQAYEMDEDWEAAGNKATQVQGDLDFNNNRSFWAGRDKYPIINSMHEDYFD